MLIAPWQLLINQCNYILHRFQTKIVAHIQDSSMYCNDLPTVHKVLISLLIRDPVLQFFV